MLTKAKKTLCKTFAALCAAIVLLGVFVLSTSAQEPTESALAETNPFSYGYEPITEPYLRRIPVNITFSKNTMYASVSSNEFVGDEQDAYLHNLAWLTVTFEGQNEDGDIEIFEVSTPYADCYYLAFGDYYRVVSYPTATVQKTSSSANVSFSIAYDNGIVPYPDSIIEAYVYIGVNPLRYGFDSNTSGGNTEEAYQNGYTDGYDLGYSNGYDTASSQIENSNYIKDLGEGFFNGLLDIFIVVEDFEVFGTKLGDIIGYLITALIVLLLVKVVAFVV